MKTRESFITLATTVSDKKKKFYNIVPQLLKEQLAELNGSVEVYQNRNG
jgi:hypothetical protein